MKRMKMIFLRVENNLTQEEFARALGYSRMYVSSIENGKFKGSPKFWYKLQKVFNISSEEIDSYKEIR